MNGSDFRRQEAIRVQGNLYSKLIIPENTLLMNGSDFRHQEAIRARMVICILGL